MTNSVYLNMHYTKPKLATIFRSVIGTAKNIYDKMLQIIYTN